MRGNDDRYVLIEKSRSYEQSSLLYLAFSVDSDCGRRAGILGIGRNARVAGQNMLPAIPGAFHYFVGATKEALTTAKILLRGKAVVGVLIPLPPGSRVTDLGLAKC